MTYSQGNRLGRYQIRSLLGSGGMGEVYHAYDPELERDVAIKVSARQFTDRFSRETKVVASLNHPNICTLHDVGPNYLVMELVEGSTLAERIKAGPIDGDEARSIARQIAEALEAAHEKGVVHRDLKGANIKITPDGLVKVLDFGLAKSSREADPEDIGNLPTFAPSMTGMGVILGTPGYMSPEQAKGQRADRRSDIWSFGVVLFEMLTGRQLFQGESSAELLAAIIKEEPNLEAVPAPWKGLLLRCLIKDPRRRMQAIGEARIMLEDGLPGTAAPSASSSASGKGSTFAKAYLGWIAAALLFVVAAGALLLARREAPQTARPLVRFDIPIENVGASVRPVAAISPDGRTLAYFTLNSDGRTTVRLREVSTAEVRDLRGTETANPSLLFWSPDSTTLFFGGRNGLMRVSVAGGEARQVCACSAGGPSGGGGAANSQGVVLFSDFGPLMQVAATGGTPLPATGDDANRGEDSNPIFLPDGRRFLYWHATGNPDTTGVYLASLGQPVPKQPLIVGTSPPFLAVSDGPVIRLLVNPEGLRGYTLNPEENAVTAYTEFPPEMNSYLSDISAPPTVSSNGIVAIPTGTLPQTIPTWFDRQGKHAGVAGEAGQYNSLDLSRNGRRLASLIASSALWIRDLDRGTNIKLPLQPVLFAGAAVWSPDGASVLFSSGLRENPAVVHVFQAPANGTAAQSSLLKVERRAWSNDWSQDGNFLLYSEQRTIGDDTDLMYVPMSGNERNPVKYVGGPGQQKQGQFSPDGQFVAYASAESGRSEIYVQPFPNASDGKWLISQSGGVEPRWNANGKELLFFSGQKLISVDVSVEGDSFAASTPKELFEAPVQPGYFNDSHRWQIAPDGNRFLLLAPANDVSSASVQILVNWP